MSKKKIKKVMDYLRVLLEKRGLKIEKIILFGSYKNGDYKEDSDIDIVVVSKYFSGKDIFEKAKILGDIEWVLMERYLVPLDIITMSPHELRKGISPVSQYVKKGDVVYG